MRLCIVYAHIVLVFVAITLYQVTLVRTSCGSSDDAWLARFQRKSTGRSKRNCYGGTSGGNGGGNGGGGRRYPFGPPPPYDEQPPIIIISSSGGAGGAQIIQPGRTASGVIPVVLSPEVMKEKVKEINERTQKRLRNEDDDLPVLRKVLVGDACSEHGQCPDGAVCQVGIMGVMFCACIQGRPYFGPDNAQFCPDGLRERQRLKLTAGANSEDGEDYDYDLEDPDPDPDLKSVVKVHNREDRGRRILGPSEVQRHRGAKLENRLRMVTPQARKFSIQINRENAEEATITKRVFYRTKTTPDWTPKDETKDDDWLQLTMTKLPLIRLTSITARPPKMTSTTRKRTLQDLIMEVREVLRRSYLRRLRLL